MRTSKIFIIVFAVLFILYIVVQLNKPREFDWTPSLSSTDKNPFGTFVLHEQLKQLFPSADIQSHRVPIYNVLHDVYADNSAYILLTARFTPGAADLSAMLDYVSAGNTVLISAVDADKKLLDTLGLSFQPFAGFMEKDSTTINFVNPALHTVRDYGFRRQTIDGYFNKINKKDSIIVLGTRSDTLPNFVKVLYGDGFFLVHAAPICFSNYFMLYRNNQEYTAKALSYIPKNVKTLHWDEYYKLGREGASTPLHFFLNNDFLKWALWLSVTAALLYVLFQAKRKQRIIPVIEPVRNTTLEFVQTVSSVYFGQKDNNSIAHKKILFWQEYIRQRYYLIATVMDANFVQQLARKSGVSKELIETILQHIQRAEAQPKITDGLLMELTGSIDEFYQLSKKIV